ncbi:protein of unknown function [Sphingomonas sp. NFR04]|uniref:DUF4349 domain-containing protein n=1 Tax=Sphingomonas sp. NFR04 TaxID=1566283 RepID=UPI0008E71EB7|nr:DUF4349 domain-containing protein [Sphingomonas sp. NFR04]SFJ63684.1 protein of unknown function [Sphingomonas sp. NFR04]
MRKFLVLGCAALLAACSSNQQGGAGETVTEAEVPGKPGVDPLKLALPQLAYRYTLSFLLPGARLAETQDRHRALCEQLGPARCQLVTLTRNDAEGRAGGALLKLRVAAADAGYFTGEAARQVSAAGGRAANTDVAGEDVSKDLTDTAARIHQRELLVARLTETLRTRKGSVADLVNAEHQVAAAQEELDKARSWQRELQGRVAMADVEIRYQALAAPASSASVGTALGEAAQGSASAFIWGMQLLLSLAIYLLPWAAVFGAGAGVAALLRRSKPAA